MILILTNPSDAHADPVETILRQRGEPVVRVDTQELASQRLAMRINPSRNATAAMDLRWAGLGLEQEISSVWYRRPTVPAVAASMSARVQEYVQAESLEVLRDLWSNLPCAWLPGEPQVLERARQKILQLNTAARTGLEVPPSLVTNDPKQVYEFYCQHQGKIISKMAASAFRDSELTHTIRRYTEPVTQRDLGYLQAVRHCPMLFQAYVDKRFELRCTVVDDSVFCAAIHSQQSSRTRHDWRRYDRSRTPYSPYELPDDISRRLVTLVRNLGLRFGAIDMIYTPDGRYVFVEINPNGQFLFIEQATSLPISAAIADALSATPPAPAEGVCRDLPTACCPV